MLGLRFAISRLAHGAVQSRSPNLEMGAWIPLTTKVGLDVNNRGIAKLHVHRQCRVQEDAGSVNSGVRGPLDFIRAEICRFAALIRVPDALISQKLR